MKKLIYLSDLQDFTQENVCSSKYFIEGINHSCFLQYFKDKIKKEARCSFLEI